MGNKCKLENKWSFKLTDDESAADQEVPSEVICSFRQDGFVVFPNVISLSDVIALNERLEEILRGQYDRGRAPDKAPRVLKSQRQQISPAVKEEKEDRAYPRKLNHHVGPLGFSGNLQNVKVIQVINVHKADNFFRRLSCNRLLGKVVAQLGGWESGARLVQDQVWAKPPGAPPLSFHRDSPYFMFTPDDVITVWIALDDMLPELGPLEYVCGSHRWGCGRVGTSNQFFQANAGKSLLKSAADREGLLEHDLEIISMAGLRAGGISIHNGLTWHGSGKNESLTQPRRGLGLHFVPCNVQFTAEAINSRLWKSYIEGTNDVCKVELPEEDFPVTWKPN